jgi:hypothetical protein
MIFFKAKKYFSGQTASKPLCVPKKHGKAIAVVQ